MIRSDFSRPEPSSANESVPVNRAVFSQLYDQYAPTLLGVITAIVNDETEAIRALEVTFTEVRSQFGQFRPESQPLFIWLLSIARRTALEATKSRIKTSLPALRLVNLGKNRSTPIRVDSTRPVAATHDAIAPPLSKLLDAVLFENYTPEEAASFVGLPIATARQQLRLAVQQLRTPKAD